MTGTPDEVEILTKLFSYVIREASHGRHVAEDDVVRMMASLREGALGSTGFRDDILLTYRGKAIRPKTAGQKRYIDAIRSNTVTFCMGPAGTGKTYLAMAMAVAALKRHEVGRRALWWRRARTSGFCRAPFRKRSTRMSVRCSTRFST